MSLQQTEHWLLSLTACCTQMCDCMAIAHTIVIGRSICVCGRRKLSSESGIPLEVVWADPRILLHWGRGGFW